MFIDLNMYNNYLTDTRTHTHNHFNTSRIFALRKAEHSMFDISAHMKVTGIQILSGLIALFAFHPLRSQC